MYVKVHWPTSGETYRHSTAVEQEPGLANRRELLAKTFTVRKVWLEKGLTHRAGSWLQVRLQFGCFAYEFDGHYFYYCLSTVWLLMRVVNCCCCCVCRLERLLER